MEPTPPEHHRYPGARGLHDRGVSFAEGPRRRGRRILRFRRRRAAIGNELAVCQRLRGGTHYFRQQARSHRRGFLSGRRSDQGRAGGQSAGHGVAHRYRGQLHRHRRPVDAQSLGMERLGRSGGLRGARSARRHGRQGRRVARKADRNRRRAGRRSAGAVPRRQRAVARGSQTLYPQRHDQPGFLPDLLRIGIQEQGHPARSRCRRRLPAQPDRGQAAARDRSRG